jgi:glycosyltransferase involved in cell wall biosynthesis
MFVKRPQLTAVNHYNVFPFNHGGSLGIRGLYKGLSEWFDINIVTFVTSKLFKSEVYISNHVKVIAIRLPEELAEKQQEIYREYKLIDAVPIVIRLYHKYPELIEKVRAVAKESEVVLAEHVYTWNIIKAACPDKHLWYRANNVEYDYKSVTWEKSGYRKNLLQDVYDIENDCVHKCEKILTVSQLEKDRFIQLYNISECDRDKFVNIRSGYDMGAENAVFPEFRQQIDDQYEFSGLFIASSTPNTIVAANSCIKIAQECSNIKIILVGTVCKNYGDIELPKNVLLAGVVSDEEKEYYLKNCDFALNLMEFGAGINVKMFEYFAFGIPVISTVYGARGIDITDGVDCIITEKDSYVRDIKLFCNKTMQEKNDISKNALKLMRSKYDWRNLSREIARIIQLKYGVDIEKSAVPFEETKLYKFETSQAYLPKPPFYIRCAGNWGQRCLTFFREHGIEPIAFVDTDKSKIGNMISDVPIISIEKYLENHKGTEVVVAVVDWSGCAKELLEMGVSLDEISIALDGINIVHLKDSTGALPYYFSLDEWKGENSL